MKISIRPIDPRYALMEVRKQALKEVGVILSFTLEMCIGIGDYRELADNIKYIAEALKKGEMPSED